VRGLALVLHIGVVAILPVGSVRHYLRGMDTGSNLKLTTNRYILE
jgi:hypothetical protein